MSLVLKEKEVGAAFSQPTKIDLNHHHIPTGQDY
jgi:hypothetical protein